MDSSYDFIGIFNGIFNDFPIIPMSFRDLSRIAPQAILCCGDCRSSFVLVDACIDLLGTAAHEAPSTGWFQPSNVVCVSTGWVSCYLLPQGYKIEHSYHRYIIIYHCLLPLFVSSNIITVLQLPQWIYTFLESSRILSFCKVGQVTIACTLW